MSWQPCCHSFPEVDFDPELVSVCTDCDRSTEMFENDSEILKRRYYVVFCLFMILCYMANVVDRPTGRMCNVHFNLVSIWSKANVKRNRLSPISRMR